MALSLARIIGTITGKLAFERTDANFQLVQTDVNSHGTQINALVPLVGLGGVVESGSNANGYYVKFADGTAICRMNVTVETYGGSGAFDVILPIALYGTVLSASITHTSLDMLFYFSVYLSGTTSVKIAAFARPYTGGGLASGTLIPTSIIVNGRWKA